MKMKPEESHEHIQAAQELVRKVKKDNLERITRFK